MKSTMLVGLGNPGTNYAGSYHNVGGLFVDYLASQNSCEFKKGGSFEYAKINIENKKFVLVRPAVFMNVVGEAVIAAIKYLDAKPKNLLVVHDDSDIEIGRYKLSFGRGAAGHKGVESIIKSIGNKNFTRVRVGIREPVKSGHARPKAETFVLKNITKKNRAKLYLVFEDIKRKVIENDTLPPAEGIIEEIGS